MQDEVAALGKQTNRLASYTRFWLRLQTKIKENEGETVGLHVV